LHRAGDGDFGLAGLFEKAAGKTGTVKHLRGAVLRRDCPLPAAASGDFYRLQSGDSADY